MFKVLQAHEEREPKAVLKTQSKRAQKRLTQQEARREEAERNGKAQFSATEAGRPTTSFAAEPYVDQQRSSLQMYEDLLCQGDLAPDLFNDITAQLERANLEPAGPGGSRCLESGFLASARIVDLPHLRRNAAVDSPPGPGPGSNAGAGPSSSMLGDQPGTWLSRQGSALPLTWPDLPLPATSGPPRAAGAGPQSRGGRAASAAGAGGGVVLRFGSGAGYGADSAANVGHGGGSGGQPGMPPTATRVTPGRLATRGALHHHHHNHHNHGQQQQHLHPLQRQGRGSDEWEPAEEQEESEQEEEEAEVEEFPELRATVPATSQQRQPLHQVPRGLQVTHRRGHGGGKIVGRNGSHLSGVKVLHTARPATHGSPLHGNGDLHQNGSGGGGGDDESSSTDLNLSLLWDLIQGGLCLRDDPLAAEGADLAGPEPAAAAAIKRLVMARFSEDDGPARGLSPEDIIAMMARAHRRQSKRTTQKAAARAAAARVDQAGGGGGGDLNGGVEEDDDESDDEPHLYLERDESKSWRRTVEWMKKNDWVRVLDTDGKHNKYRRWLPNGQIQTQTVCCSPSDTQRGIRNLQADLARKDAQANVVIRAWRHEERERRRRERAAAAAAMAAQEG